MCSFQPTKATPARIHLLAAKESPVVVIVRRKPSRMVHILRWNTETDQLDAGSWFHGRLYEMRSDVSFDGCYMIYLAMGSSGETWTGVCRPPFLRTIVHWPNMGSWHGGGVFMSATCVEINAGYAKSDALATIRDLKERLPFEFDFLANPGYGEDEGVLYPRLERDGFQRVGPLPEEIGVPGNVFKMVCEDDPGWITRPSPEHPILRVRYRGYSSGRGRIFEWDLPEHPGLIDEKVSWATFDSLGQLIVARLGVLFKYRLKDLASNTPSSVFDLEGLERPSVQSQTDRF